MCAAVHGLGANMAKTFWLLASFGETGSFGGLAPFSGLKEGRKNRVVPEGMSFHFPRCSSRALHFTKYGQEPWNFGDVCIQLGPRQHILALRHFW
jgi:hypothetical protein